MANSLARFAGINMTEAWAAAENRRGRESMAEDAVRKWRDRSRQRLTDPGSMPYNGGLTCRFVL